MVVRHADSLNQHTSGKEAAAASFPSKRAARGRDMGKQKREQKMRDADSQTAEQLSPSLLTCFVLLAMLAAALAYHLLMWPAAGGTNSGGGVPGPPTQLQDVGDRVADRWAPQYPNGTLSSASFCSATAACRSLALAASPASQRSSALLAAYCGPSSLLSALSCFASLFFFEADSLFYILLWTNTEDTRLRITGDARRALALHDLV